MKFLGNFARNVHEENALLAKVLFQIFGNLTMLSPCVIRARKLRRLDTTRDTKSVDLYCRIIWYAREGIKILDEYVLPMVAKFSHLKVLAYKIRASYYHLYVLFHNHPAISLKGPQISTPPGLKSPFPKIDKGKGKSKIDPSDPIFRPNSVQPTHPLEGGPVGGVSPPRSPTQTPSFLLPAADFRPLALRAFQEANALADRYLWDSHPMKLSVRVEFAAFLYDCLHQRDESRALAKRTIKEVYEAKEGMDDDMFEDAAELVSLLGRMMRRGLGGNSSGGTATPKASSPKRSKEDAPPLPIPVSGVEMSNKI